MAKVIIGVDPHKLSATIEVVDRHEKLLGTGRFSTDQVGYTAMRSYARAWPDHLWAVEGSNGAGRPLAQRLLEAGEQVVDVPAKLAARARLFDTGHNRKTDARDAHSIAIVAVRTKDLRVLRADGELEALRMLCDRREELTRLRVQTVNQLQRLLAELVPGTGKKDLTALQALSTRWRFSLRCVLVTSPARLAAGSPSRNCPGRGEDEEVHRRTQGPGHRPRLTTDGPTRCRTRSRRAEQSPFEPRLATCPTDRRPEESPTHTGVGSHEKSAPAGHLNRVWPDTGPARKCLVAPIRRGSSRRLMPVQGRSDAPERHAC
jgi:hypothetical protein